MPHAAPEAGLRKKTSPAPLCRADVVRPTTPEAATRRRLPTVAVVAAALAASLVATMGCQSNEDDGVSAERHVRRPARSLEHDPNAPPTGSVVTIASTAPVPVPTPIPMPLGGAVAPVVPPPVPPPVPTTKKTTTSKPVSSVAVPVPHAMPGGAKAVVPTT